MATNNDPPARRVYHGYLVFLSTFVLIFGTTFVPTLGLFIGPFSQTFPEYGIETFALYCTIPLVSMFLFSFVGGIAQEALDSRGCLHLLFSGGGFLIALGFFWSSVSDSMLGLLGGSFVTGIGLGVGNALVGGVLVMWFNAARGRALLLSSTGGGLGMIFFAWAIAKLLEANEGVDDPWRPTMQWLGGFSFVVSLIASIPMRMPLPGEVEQYEKSGGVENDKEDEGAPLTSDSNYGSLPVQSGATHAKGRRSSAIALEQLRAESGHGRQSHTGRRSTILGSFQALATSSLTLLSDERRSLIGGVEATEKKGYTLKEVALTRTNICVLLFSAVSSFAIANLDVLMPPYIAFIGMSPSVAGQVMAVFGFGSLLSNLTLGGVVDRFGARPIFSISFFLLSASYFAWPYCTTEWSLSTLAFFFAYFINTAFSMPLIILADAFSESSSEHLLALIGLLNLVMTPGILFGSYIASILINLAGGHYGLTAIVSGLVMLVSALVLAMIPSPEVQQQALLDGA